MVKIKWEKSIKKIVMGMTILTMLGISLAGCAAKNPTAGQVNNTNVSPTNSTATLTPQAGGDNSINKTATDIDGDGIPNDIEKTYGTNPYLADTDGDGINDKKDKVPAFSENLIKETSVKPLEIKIKDARVEDNKAADHLEITMTNTSATEINNFDIYYTITDKVDKNKEAYYQVLSGFSIKPGESKTIHFDNKTTEAGHYFGNMNGLYGTSKNGLTFNAQLHANGFKALDFVVEKAKGTAEVAD